MFTYTKIYKLWIVTLLTIICFTGCKDDKKQEEIISVEEMTDFLFHYHVAYTYGDKAITDYHNRQVHIHELIDGLLEREGWSREEFYRSYEYYVANPVLLDTIYSRILTEMQAVQNDPTLYQ